jgi:tetratricopeptide (TPR) repeat protein
MAQKHHPLTRLTHASAPTTFTQTAFTRTAFAQTASALNVLQALAMTALLSGCSLFSPRPSAPGAPTPSAQPPAPPAGSSPLPTPSAPSSPSQHAPAQPPRENSLSPATRSLVTQAKTLMSHGDFDGASSTLDRALRIEPNNPLLWIERGRLRLAESDAHQAEGCGRKALALASGDPNAQRQAGRLLADALRAQQRNQEAHDVESQPFMH